MFQVLHVFVFLRSAREKEWTIEYQRVNTANRKVGHFQRTYATHTHNSSRNLRTQLASSDERFLFQMPHEKTGESKKNRNYLDSRQIAISHNYYRAREEISTRLRVFVLLLFEGESSFSLLSLSQPFKNRQKNNQRPRCQFSIRKWNFFCFSVMR